MEISFLALLFLPILFFFLFRRDSTKKTGPQPIKTYPLVGILPEFIKNRERFLEWITECIIKTPNRTITIPGIRRTAKVVTANPTNIEHVLKTNFHNYPKGEEAIEMLKDFLGHGIFNSDGEDWLWQRKEASYEFNKRSLRNFLVEVVQYEIVHRLVPLLTKAAIEHRTFDLQDVLERFMFDTICKVAFNDDPACLTDDTASQTTASAKFMKAFEDSRNLITGRFMDVLQIAWKVKKTLNVGTERQLKESVSTVHTYAMNIIKERKAKGKDLDEYNDLLSRFASRKEASDEFLRDTIINFMVAGRDTTSSALVWFFWILLTRPDVKEKIVEEVERIRVHSKVFTDTFNYDELHEMHYLHAALTESMRLFPPVAADTVSCLNDDELPDGTVVRKGWTLAYSMYSMARLVELWGEDCGEYRPERWLEKGAFRPESPFRYLVFNAGPRACLGREMAYIQTKSVVVAVLERFEVDVELERGKVPGYVLTMTMRMKGGLPVKVRQKLQNSVLACKKET